MMGNPLMILGGRATIHIGDVMARLRDLPDDFFDTCVTSPPYWGLRDYGTAIWVDGDIGCQHVAGGSNDTPWANGAKTSMDEGRRIPRPLRDTYGHCALCGARRVDYQLGLEPTLADHIEAMVAVFAEVRRVLKSTGTVFLNYGDCYASSANGRSAADTKTAGRDDRTFRDKPFGTIGAGALGPDFMDRPFRQVVNGYKEKDLCMVPNLLAIALRAAGWWVRSEIIWGKKNPMPDSSGNGRPSTAHEKIFLLTKSGDADVWRARDTGELSFRPDLAERAELITKPGTFGPRWIKLGSYYDAGAVIQPSSPTSHRRMAQDVSGQAGSNRAHAGGKANGPMKAVALRGGSPKAVGPRHVGQINHTGLDTLERGQGRLLRNFEEGPLTVWPMATVAYKGAHFATFPPELVERAIAAGAPPDGGMVLDPFGGSGTTALVALRMGRKAHLIELKPEYATMARNRLERDWMGEDERRYATAKDKGTPPPGPLFETPLEAAE